MLTILSGARRYPMQMARFFESAMRRAGHTVLTVGPYSGDGGDIPWPGAPKFPQYVDKPTIVLPEGLDAYPLAAIKRMLPEQVDAVFSFNAGFRLTGKLDAPSVLYGTDPHAIDYRTHYREYDYFFNAQKMIFGQPNPDGTEWLPLAYDPFVHTCDNPILPGDRPVDVCFIGVRGTGPERSNPYWQRYQTLEAIRAAGYRTDIQTGLIFQECTAAYNQAKISFNWSSSWDLPMRIWEGWGYGCCVLTNRLPGLEECGFIDGETCVIYDTQEEALEKVEWLLSSGEWQRIALAGYQKGLEIDATYDRRVQTMLTSMGLI